jgi:hypothetical protein
MAKDKKGKGSGTKDACYHKVKSRYSVWPSAYASGALVKCRKVGAKNWGNKSESFEVQDGVVEGVMPEPIDPKKHKEAQKKQKMRNLAIGNENPNEKKVAEKKAGGPKMMGEGKYSDSETYVKGTAPVRDPQTGESYPKETYKKKSKKVASEEVELEEKKKSGDPCWVGYKQVGMKKKGAKMVPNCVPEETEVEEGYKPIDKDKENKMYRRAGNLARTSLASKGKKKLDSASKSAKIVSAISRQKENERFDKMADIKARDNYTEEVVQSILEKCWKGYEKKGMKTMFGKRYPNCVKKEEVNLQDLKIKGAKGPKSAKDVKLPKFKDTDNPSFKKEEVEVKESDSAFEFVKNELIKKHGAAAIVGTPENKAATAKRKAEAEKNKKKPAPDTRTDAQKMTDATGPRPGSRYRGD